MASKILQAGARLLAQECSGRDDECADGQVCDGGYCRDEGGSEGQCG